MTITLNFFSKENNQKLNNLMSIKTNQSFGLDALYLQGGNRQMDHV